MNVFFTHKWCAAIVVVAFLGGTLAGIALLNNVRSASPANSKKSVSGFESQEWRTGVSGRVVAVAENSLTISLLDGSQQTFPITEETKILVSALNKELKRFDPTQETVTLKDITTKDQVGVNLISDFKGDPRVEQVYILRGI